MANSGIGKSDQQRRRTRVKAQLPVSIDEEHGLTRDISASGMFIVQGRQQEIGARVEFLVDLKTRRGTMKLCCEGEVVRVQEVDGRVGIGIKILKQFGTRLILDSLRVPTDDWDDLVEKQDQD